MELGGEPHWLPQFLQWAPRLPHRPLVLAIPSEVDSLPIMGQPRVHSVLTHTLEGGAGLALGHQGKARIRLSVCPPQLMPSICSAGWGSGCLHAAHASFCSRCLAAKDSFTHPVLASVSPSLRVGGGQDPWLIEDKAKAWWG